MRVKLLLFCLCISISLFAQSPRVDSLKNIVETHTDLPDSLYLSTLNLLYREYSFRNNMAKANYYLDLLIEESIKRGQPTFNRQGYISKAYILHRKRENRKQARALIDSVLVEAIKAKDTLNIGRCYNYLGYEGIYDLNAEDKCHYFEQAYQLLAPINLEALFWSITMLSECALKKNDFKKIDSLAAEHLRIAHQTKNPILLFKAHRIKADNNYRLLNYEACTNSVLEAIKIAKTQNYTTRDLVACYLMVADLYHLRKDSTKAFFYSKKAHEIGQQINSPAYELTAANSLAFYYITYNKNLPQAKALIERSIQLTEEYRKFNFFREEASSHYFMGLFYETQEDLVLAKKHYIKSISICEKKGCNSSRAQASLSGIIENDTDIEAGLDTFFNTDTIKVIDLLYVKFWTYQTKMNLAEKAKNHEQAFLWAKKLREIEEEMHEENLTISIKEKLLERELATKAQELASQEKLVKTTNFKNNVLSIAILLTIALLGLLYHLYRSRQKHSQSILEKNRKIIKANEVVATLNNELTLKNELLATKNDLLAKEIIDYISSQGNRDQQLKEVQMEIENAVKESSYPAVDWQIIQTKLKHLISSKDDWQLFKQKIEKLHPNFFSQLSLKHPNLNKREQTHCAYLLIGLSIKQVAESLFISTKTVESARYRLKKKMGLEKAQGLGEYLKTLS